MKAKTNTYNFFTSTPSILGRTRLVFGIFTSIITTIIITPLGV
ncbi:hypothetical protein [Neptunitalea lumnitzerae]|nr:hypothetical protein [Neptunitalea sp. Y10]